jgi:four helix bundle protein
VSSKLSAHKLFLFDGDYLVQKFQQLDLWKKAHQLVLKVYKVSASLPAAENLGLTANLRRTAIQIAKSISEGAGKDSDAEFAVDLKRARAAGHELEYLVLLCRDLGFIAPEVHDVLAGQIVEVRKMTSGLIHRVQLTPQPVP